MSVGSELPNLFGLRAAAYLDGGGGPGGFRITRAAVAFSHSNCSAVGTGAMNTQGPSPWSSSLRKGAVSILVAVVAVDIAAHLFVAALPVLIPVGIALSAIYAVWHLHRRNRSGW